MPHLSDFASHNCQGGIISSQEDEEDILDIFGSSPEEVEAMRLLETSIAEGDDPLEAHADGEEAEADGLEKVIGKDSLHFTGCLRGITVSGLLDGPKKYQN